MGAVQQPLFTVSEVTLEQFPDESAIPCVGHRNQQLPGRGEDIAAGFDNPFRSAQVLQHVGADDIIVTFTGEDVGQDAVFEIGDLDPTVMGASHIGFGVVVGQPIHGATERLLKVFAQCAAACAQVQYGGSLVDQTDQDREGCAFIAGDLSAVHMQILVRLRHARIMPGCGGDFLNRFTPQGAVVGPIGNLVS